MIRSLRYFVWVAVLVSAAVLLVASTSTARADKRVALVIGNSNYQNVPTLPNPAADARSIYQKFKSAGFDVGEVQLDVGNLEFKRALREFELKANDADIAVVFFAGHGVEIRGKNYMIPVDAKLASERDAPDEAIELDRIFETVDGAKSLRLVILDACRDNPFVMTRQYVRGEGPRGEIVTRGLGRIEPQTAYTLVAYAAKAGTVAEDGSGEHSPFTQALLDKLFEPGIGIRVAFGRVVDEVQRATRGRQLPYLDGSIGEEDISLISGPKPPVAAAQPNQSDDKAAVDYQLANEVNTKEAWVAFLSRYKTGFYVTLAKGKLQRLLDADEPKVAILPPQQRPSPGPPGPEDDREWASINKDDPSQLQDFIKRYPNSSHSPDAAHRLKVLEDNAQERDWDGTKNANDQVAFRQFIQRYPKSPHVAEAEDRIKQLQVLDADRKWGEIKGTGDRGELEKFIKLYPGSPHVKEAQDRIDLLTQVAEDGAWDKVKDSHEPAILTDFVNRYPNSRYAAEAKKRLEIVQGAEREWERLKSSSNPADLQGFIRRYQDLPRVADAQARLDAIVADNAKREWEKLKSSSDQVALQGFVNRYQSSPLAAEASARLESLRKEAQAQDAKAAEDRQRKAQADAEARQKAEQDKEAKAAWDRVSKTDPVAVQEFINLHPSSSVAVEAGKLLATLHEKSKKAEDDAWNRASQRGVNQVALLQDFIARYPESAHRSDAENLMDTAKADAEKTVADDSWKKMQKSINEATLKDFINRYPSSSHTADAQMLLNKLLSAEEWDKIKKSSDPDTLQKFVDAHPDSPNIDDANKRLAALNSPSLKSTNASSNTPELVTAAQKALRGLGCYSGKANGVLDEATKQSMGRYLAAQGKSGIQDEVTQDFVDELGKQPSSKCLPSKIAAPDEERQPRQPKRPVAPAARQEERPSQVKQVAERPAPAPRTQPPPISPPAKSVGGGGGGGGIGSGPGIGF